MNNHVKKDGIQGGRDPCGQEEETQCHAVADSIQEGVFLAGAECAQTIPLEIVRRKIECVAQSLKGVGRPLSRLLNGSAFLTQLYS
jgi:hypothetical protein